MCKSLISLSGHEQYFSRLSEGLSKFFFAFSVQFSYLGLGLRVGHLLLHSTVQKENIYTIRFHLSLISTAKISHVEWKESLKTFKVTGLKTLDRGSMQDP